LFAGLRKYTLLIFTKFGGKAAHGPRMNALDFGDNPNQVTLGLQLTVDVLRHTREDCVTVR